MQTFPHTPETLSGLLLLADHAQERGEDCQRKLAVGWAERTRRHGARRPRVSPIPEIVRGWKPDAGRVSAAHQEMPRCGKGERQWIILSESIKQMTPIAVF